MAIKRNTYIIGAVVLVVLVMSLFLSKQLDEGTGYAFAFTKKTKKSSDYEIPSKYQQYRTYHRSDCYDSDGGLKYDRKGYAEYGKRVDDRCLPQVNLLRGEGLGRRAVKERAIMPGEYRGKYHTLLDEAYCGRDFRLRRPTVYAKRYDCFQERKSCYDGACFAPTCTNQVGGFSYTGLVATRTGQLSVKTEQFTKECKDSNTLLEYSCKQQLRRNKFKVLDPTKYKHMFIANPGQRYPHVEERRCGTGTVSCTIAGVRITKELRGCLSHGGYAICADDLNRLSAADRNRECLRHGGGGSQGGVGDEGQPQQPSEPIETTGEQRCFDSDNGIQPQMEGYTEIRQEGEEPYRDDDYCWVDDNDQWFVKEFYCSGGERYFRDVPCAKRCVTHCDYI